MIYRSLPLVFTACLLLISSAVAQPATGTWNVRVDADGTVHTSVLTVAEEGGALAGTIVDADGSTVQLTAASLAGDTLSFSFRSSVHGPLSGRGVVNGDMFHGTLSAEGVTYAMMATRGAGAPADVSGTWHIVGDVVGNPIDQNCTLVQEGSALTGSCGSGEQTVAIEGEVSGEKFSFEHGGEYEGTELTISYSGRRTGPSALEGSIGVMPYGVEGNFSASPVAP